MPIFSCSSYRFIYTKKSLIISIFFKFIHDKGNALMNIVFLFFLVATSFNLFAAQPLGHTNSQRANAAVGSVRSNSVVGKKRKDHPLVVTSDDDAEQEPAVEAQPVKPLFDGCTHMTHQAIKEGLDQGANPNGYTKNKFNGLLCEWAPLHYLAMHATAWSTQDLEQCAQLLMQAGASLHLRQRVLIASIERGPTTLYTVPEAIRHQQDHISKDTHDNEQDLAKYNALRNALIKEDQEISDRFEKLVAETLLASEPSIPRELSAIIVAYCREKTYQELENESYKKGAATNVASTL